MIAKHLLVCIPTYNERENVILLYDAIKKLPLDTHILFIDDNSPDGTGAVIKILVENDATTHAIHRPQKMGLGTAHKEAFDFAHANNYPYLLTMDADFTHHPSYIPELFAKKELGDIIIGSRYARGGGMSGWGTIRLPFTYFWRGMIKYGLGMPYDCTGAFRLYNVAFLKPTLYKPLKSHGFSFCMESLYYFKKAGARIAEVPIKAHNRIHGASKLSSSIMREVARMFFRLLGDRLRSPL
jgi:dolichol-phosphate mannosyltransferase